MAREKKSPAAAAQAALSPAVDYLRGAIHWWVPFLYVLISNAFYLRTYDSAQVKITLLQMGGLALFALWTCLLALEGRKAIRKEDLIFLSPFLLYMGYIVLSFLNAPYKWLSVDDFVRYMVYTGVSVVVISEFDEKAVNRFTKIFLAGAAVTILYGLVQIADWQFYARHSSVRLDPFVWRAAFGPRVFSTYGNPNFFADFALLVFFVFLAQYLKTRSFWYIPILLADAACLYFTETKGAWMGFGIASAIFTAMYSVFFLRRYYERYKVAINAAALSVLLGCAALVGVFAAKRMNSVNFRVFTWLSTWEMIETKPFTGTGVGTFKVIYPAFRRPQIFHIEGKHNTETDHAEDEYLEQWMDNGLLGFGLFLWIIVFTVVTGLRALGAQTRALLEDPDLRPPPRAYDLLGYLAAFAAMMAHNFFDVSMRFVSSGIYFGLLPGLVIAIARGKALYETHQTDYSSAALLPKNEEPEPSAWLWPLRLAAFGGLLWLLFSIWGQFSELQGPLADTMPFGDFLQWHVAWVVMIPMSAWLCWKFLRTAWMANGAAALLIILAMLYPMNLFWGFFRANVYHNLAIYFSKERDWGSALSYYNLVNKYDPSFVMAYYFRGNVYKDRFDLVPQYRPEWGDEDNAPRTDYDRAIADYSRLRELAPNYVQTFYQLGELYMKKHDSLVTTNPDEANKYLDRALHSFSLYHNLDPVFPYTYYHRARIYEAKGQTDMARREYEDNINAPYCRQKGHTHESSEAYMSLGLFKSKLRLWGEAETAFKRASELDPKNQSAKTSYEAARMMREHGGTIRIPGPAAPQQAAPAPAHNQIDNGVHFSVGPGKK
ncbi:MAG: O-antigen ligase family protein [Elusimicrobiales bacterium]